MNLKKWILRLSPVAIAIFATILIFAFLSKEKEQAWTFINQPQYESVDGYNIYEISDKKIVANEHSGIELAIPKDWLIEKVNLNSYAREVRMFSPDLERNEGKLFQSQGCEIGIFIEIRSQSSAFRDELGSSQNQEDIMIGGHRSVRGTLYESPGEGSYILVETPVNEKIYYFAALVPSEEKERVKCLKIFEEVLRTVSINTEKY